ncbi:thiol:disulfide interchange protein DsbA/DsbL [Reinekea marinisedimentorum]|uniref:Thiol:disulfide interchange protein n=1 Tax=Reinekea marinisedimentorum TaxID=230495 RepID=A0A4R3IDJ5_9GAMM|nr:thiol:disulfide interchange protein DsbA/DsbL [Reinekea marinisedimentorum]TCS43846.1 thiol:disulfide interchange protein DsbA [Reinekea marinisedimentorum]
MFKRFFVITLLITAASLIHAEDSARYVDGKHYTTLSTPLKTSYRGEEIGEIMEFFSYSCIHCARLEASIPAFLEQKPDNIRFTQVPVVFNEYQKPEVRAYYVVELLGLGETAHIQIFNEINVNRNRMNTDAKFADFFTRFGISKEEYMKQAYSFAVNAKMNQSIILTRDSQITGTPSVVANGKYRIDSGAVGSNEMALYAAQWVIQNEAATAE